MSIPPSRTSTNDINTSGDQLNPTAEQHPDDETVESERPKIHFTSHSWINDPCAPAYDPATGLYHLFYQWNPYGCEWGNMSWGHITSKDMVTWTDVGTEPSLAPGESYDKEGIFTGCMGPVVESKPLTAFYSSVQHLPMHWSTPPYPHNAAGLSVATSNDHGRTWVKSTRNPILLGEPESIAVSGFRDPFVATWPALAEIRGEDTSTLYGLISGGIEGKGPTSFLYAIDPDDLESWKYLSPLVEIPLRYEPGPKWGGNFGMNWECVNVRTLVSGPTSREFLILSAEGDVERKHIRDHRLPTSIPPRAVRQQLWMAGRLKEEAKGETRFEYEYGGLLDHGSYYAANSFIDPKTGRCIVYGWIPEEDCTLEYAKRKGWNGALAMPRELFMLSIPNVSKALKSPLSTISNVEVVQDGPGRHTLHTLGVRPIAEMEENVKRTLQAHASGPLSLPKEKSERVEILRAKGSLLLVEATISIRPGCEKVGFYIRHSLDFSTHTKVLFDTSDESIVVDRRFSNQAVDFNKCVEKGPFTLFEQLQHDTNSPGALEKLQIRIYLDGDVLEVFANERFALATMIYTGSSAVNNLISAFAEGGRDSALFEEVNLWVGQDLGR